MLTIYLGMPPINQWSKMRPDDFETLVFKEWGITVKGYSMGRYYYMKNRKIVAEYIPNGSQSEGIIYKNEQSNDMKRLFEQSNTEKAKNLHELIPHQIPPFLDFLEERINIIVERPEELREVLATDIPPQKWMELLQIINVTIVKNRKQLIADSNFFSNHLFKGYIGVFVIHCLQLYMSVCNDDQFFKAVELFFDV